MEKIKEFSLIGMIIFTLIYNTIGNPDSVIWSFSWFITNSITLLILFSNYNGCKLIKFTGISLSISVLIFIILKYICKFNIDREYSLIPFIICLIYFQKIPLTKYLKNTKIYAAIRNKFNK